MEDKPKSLLRFFSKSEWVNVFLTAVIAATGVVGIVLVIQGESDTARIRDAAEKEAGAAAKSAQAARDFADTAALINGGIGDAVKKLDAQAKATQKSVELSANQFRLAQASDLAVLNASLVDRVTSRFTIVNFGNLAAKNIVVRVREDHFPSIDVMNLYRYDPLTEQGRFRSGQPGKYDSGALSNEERAETSSAIGPIWHNVGHLRHNGVLSYEYRFPFALASPPEKSVICFLVVMDWDDAIEHRKGSACQLFVNGEAAGCQQFVLGLPAPKIKDQ